MPGIPAVRGSSRRFIIGSTQCPGCRAPANLVPASVAVATEIRTAKQWIRSGAVVSPGVLFCILLFVHESDHRCTPELQFPVFFIVVLMGTVLPVITLTDSRLMRQLARFDVPDIPSSDDHILQRLAVMMDFGASMKLAALHDELQGQAFESADTQADAGQLREAVFDAHARMVRTVVDSYTPDAGLSRLRLPSLDESRPLEFLATFEPYHRFYAAHQREFEMRVNALQLRVRELASAISPDMARLVVLDETMRGILSGYSRKTLATIPELLGRRFDRLIGDQRTDDAEVDSAPRVQVLAAWTAPDGWLGRFQEEMRELLLAELDLRLMPILGLLEATTLEVED